MRVWAIRFALLVGVFAVATVAVLGLSPGDVEVDGRAYDAGRRFLQTYVARDGRVVRHDEGGDTVSEGQAYGMLIAVALDDEDTFRRIWWWTRTHLQRGDGLLSHRWAEGSVSDPQPAADADLDTAHALMLAAERFDDPVLSDDAQRIARGILAEETARVRTAASDAEANGAQTTADDALVLVAGPWAHPRAGRTRQLIVNPSYFSQPAFAALEAATTNHAWTMLDRSSYDLLRALTEDGSLPPDWAAAETSGRIRPIGAPNAPKTRPLHGLDAARVTVRAAMSCKPAWRQLAASAAQIYPPADDLPLRLTLDGRPASDDRHPLMLIASAAAAHAAGDTPASTTQLLDDAEQLERRHPSYYGAAWVALGRLWLDATVGPC
jgi:endoglucanase